MCLQGTMALGRTELWDGRFLPLGREERACRDATDRQPSRACKIVIAGKPIQLCNEGRLFPILEIRIHWLAQTQTNIN
jgi:hypothetical protein